MTVFRHAAARRGVVISAIGPAKWKTAFQSLWVGSAYFWFFAATSAANQGWSSAAWLRTVRHPTLIVHGDGDPLVPLANAWLMAWAMPTAELHVVRGGATDVRG